LISPPYPNEANKSGYGFYILYSAEATIKLFEKPIKPRMYGRNNAMIGRDAVSK
jgi:hypothetical protein